MKAYIKQFFVDEYQLSGPSMVRSSMNGVDGGVEVLLPDRDGDLIWVLVGDESDALGEEEWLPATVAGML